MKNPHTKIFGKVIRQYRQKKKLTQEELALESGLDRTYISLLELGSNSPSLDTMLALCNALNLSLSQLVIRMEDELDRNKPCIAYPLGEVTVNI